MFKPGEIEGIPLEIEQQFSELEMRIMEDIVRRLKANGNDITRAADWQIHRLHELGVSKRVIKKYIKDSLKLDSKEINHIYKNVIRRGYERDESIYKYKGKPMIPYKDNEGLQQLIAAVSAQTNGEFKNITQTMGFAKRENGQLKFTKLSDYYQKTLDGAMLDITSGAFDYNTVLKRVVKEMTNSGLRTVDYASGKSLRVESAARMAVMTGVSQVTAQINESNAKELDTEYFEVTCHGGARPEHQEWQGKVYTKKELGTICGLGAADGLCGCNCYHDYYPFFPGISERAYTDEELEKLKKEENTPVEYNGKHYTKYEATQKQRSLERTMRAQRQQINLLQQGGASEDDIILARGRYRATSSEYTRFSKAMKLPQQRERVTVDALGNVGVGKYTMPASKMSSSSNNTVSMPTPGKLITSEQLEEFTNNMNSLGIEISGFDTYRGEQEMLQTIHTEYSRLAEMFPDEIRNMKLSYTSDDDISNFGWYDPKNKTIYLNKTIFDDTEYAKKSYLQSLDEHHFPKGTKIEGVFYHEFGHHYKYEHDINCVDAAKKAYHNVTGKYMSIGEMKAHLIKDLSVYSIKETNPNFQEVIAECFNMWYTSNNKSKFCIEFMKKIGVTL